MQLLFLIIFTIAIGLVAIYFPLIFYPRHFKFQRFTKDKTWQDRLSSVTAFRAGIIAIFATCITYDIIYLTGVSEAVSNLLNINLFYARMIIFVPVMFIVSVIMHKIGRKKDMKFGIPEAPNSISEDKESHYK